MPKRTRSERNWRTAEPDRGGQRRHAGEQSRSGSQSGEDAFGDDRFTGEEGGERGHGDDHGVDASPGSAVGGSYDAGGGYSRRDYDPDMYPGSRGSVNEDFVGGDDYERGAWSHAEPSWQSEGGARGRGSFASGSSGTRTQDFGWAGGASGYGQWGAPGNGPYGAVRGQGGYGRQWGSPAGTRQGDWRAEWNREHGMRGGDPWSVPGPHAGRGPQGYERSDDRILEDVCERLTRHGEVDASEIRVRCEGREVILEGTVDDRRTKRLAEDIADSVTGVRDVQNRLRLRDRDDERATGHSSGSAGSAPEEPRNERPSEAADTSPRPRRAPGRGDKSA